MVKVAGTCGGLFLLVQYEPRKAVVPSPLFPVTYDSSAWGGRAVQDSGMVQRRDLHRSVKQWRPDIGGGVNGPSAFLYSFSSKLGFSPSCVAAADFILLQRFPCNSCGDPSSPSTKEQ
nr:hypothetical protein Itr_chr14CG13650 [Ipomoea trifida]